MKEEMRFERKRKLSLQFFGPYKVLRHSGEVAYGLHLSPELAAIHLVFYVSMLNKCIGDPSLVVPLESIRVKDNLSYKEILVEIQDRQVRRQGIRMWCQ